MQLSEARYAKLKDDHVKEISALQKLQLSSPLEDQNEKQTKYQIYQQRLKQSQISQLKLDSQLLQDQLHQTESLLE